jgi:tetratricopeptide (TPR) repeat protein
MFRFTIEIYNRIKKNLRNTRWILHKSDNKILNSERLNRVPLSRRDQYILHLVEAVRQSAEWQKKFNQFRSIETKEDFDEAYQLSLFAIASYKNAVRLYSNSAGTWNNLGVQLSCNQVFKEPNSKNYSESLQAFWVAIKNDFVYHRAWFNIGVIYECKNNTFIAGLFYFIAGIFETFGDALNLLMTSFFYCSQFSNWANPYILNELQKLSSSSFILYYFIARNIRGLTSYLNESFQESRISPRTLQFFRQKYQDIILFSDDLFQHLEEGETYSHSKESRPDYPIEEEELLPQESAVQHVDQLLTDRNSKSLINYLYDLVSDDFENLDDFEVSFENLESLIINYPKNLHKTQQQLNAVGSALKWLVNYAVLDLNIISFQPNRSKDWEILGRELVGRNQFLEGIFSFCYAIKISCDRIAAESWYYKGIAHFHREYYEESITCFDRALELKPGYTEPLEYKGHAHNEIAEYTQAIIVFKQFLDHSPQHTQSYVGLGNAQYDIYDDDSSIKTFEKLLSIQKEDLNFYVSLSQPKYRLDKTRLARIIEESENNDLVNLDKELRSTESGKLIEEIKSFFIKYWENYLEYLKLRIKIYKLSLYSDSTFNIFCQTNTVDIYFESQFISALSLYYKLAYVTWDISRLEELPNNKERWLRLSKDYLIYSITLIDKSNLYERLLEIIEVLILVNQMLSEITSSYSERNLLLQERSAWQIQGENILARLLSGVPSKGKQFRLFLKFSTLRELRIDQLAQSRSQDDQRQALVYAEFHKNLCLEHIKHGYCKTQTDFSRITYQGICEIIQDQKTALIYWHISPASITTFIVKRDSLKVYRHSQWRSNKWYQILNNTRKTIFSKRIRYIRGFYFPKTVDQVSNFESWVVKWKRAYSEYRKAHGDRSKHSWRLNFRSDLNELKVILGISSINKYLSGINNLVLLPHRELHLLPIHLLFPDQFSLHYLPSVFFGEQSERLLNPTEEGILFVGGHEANLRFAKWEGAALRNFYNKRSLTIGKGYVRRDIFQTLTEQVERLQQYGLNVPITALHFSGHAEHHTNQPWKSAIILENYISEGQRSNLPDKFNVRDILRNSDQFRHYNLICLSACETGINESTEIIKEYIGLSSAFLASGSDYIVSSLWRVPDRVTALLFVKFYSLLTSPSNASSQIEVSSLLRQSQFWIRDLTIDKLNIFIEENISIFTERVYKRRKSLRQNLEEDFLGNSLTSDNFAYELTLDAFIASVGHMPLLKIVEDDNNLLIPYSHPYYWAGFTVTSIKA